MWLFKIIIVWLFLFTMSCDMSEPDELLINSSLRQDSIEKKLEVRGALVSTRFQSFEQLKKVIDIQYSDNCDIAEYQGEPWVKVIHKSNGKKVQSVLTEGVSELDFIDARDSGFVSKIKLVILSPYAIYKRKELKAVSMLARKNWHIYGEGTPAFYDISKQIIANIDPEDLELLDSIDLNSEKGYFNTVNHILAQSFMTSLFSEKLADLVADAHERKNLPEIISGNFTTKQIADLENGPVDNYVDIINNEWGQEIGKVLKAKYNIHSEMIWSSELLANYLNDLQSYFGWCFQVSFKPFGPEDRLVKKFSQKLNKKFQPIFE